MNKKFYHNKSRHDLIRTAFIFMYLAEVLLSSPVATVYPDTSGLHSRFCTTLSNVVPIQTGNFSKVRPLIYSVTLSNLKFDSVGVKYL